jgi:hypothetical protein
MSQEQAESVSFGAAAAGRTTRAKSPRRRVASGTARPPMPRWLRAEVCTRNPGNLDDTRGQKVQPTQREPSGQHVHLPKIASWVWEAALQHAPHHPPSAPASGLTAALGRRGRKECHGGGCLAAPVAPLHPSAPRLSAMLCGRRKEKCMAARARAPASWPIRLYVYLGEYVHN